jgi:hypothetical protein
MKELVLKTAEEVPEFLRTFIAKVVAEVKREPIEEKEEG